MLVPRQNYELFYRIRINESLLQLKLSRSLAYLLTQDYLIFSNFHWHKRCETFVRSYRMIIGLSASAAEAYGFTSVRACVRPSVRHTSYLEKRASDFDDFLHKATS